MSVCAVVALGGLSCRVLSFTFRLHSELEILFAVRADTVSREKRERRESVTHARLNLAAL